MLYIEHLVLYRQYLSLSQNEQWKIGTFPTSPFLSQHNAKWSLYMFIFVLLKLKLQYFGHLMWRTDSLENTLMLAKTEGRIGEGDNRGWDGWMPSLSYGHEFKQALGVGDGQGSLTCYSPWGCKKLDMTEQLNWICIIKCYNKCVKYIIRFLSVWWSLTPSSYR